MSAASLLAVSLALTAHAPAATAPSPIVPVRWVAGAHAGFAVRPGGWRGGCCWGHPGWVHPGWGHPGWGGWGWRGWGWGWGWGLGASFGWGWAAPWPVPYAVALPPPPEPPPAPAAPRSFIVYFNWDRADLTANARQVIAQAARAAGQSHIAVKGYTDLSGTAGYNAALSARRAAAVAAELARDGVDRAAITVQSYGKARPAVPTPDGQRDPHNRDVEIDLGA